VARRYPVGHHGYADFVRADEPAPVALRLELIEAKYVLPAREVWQDARAIRHGGAEFFIPAPEHRVLYALLQAQIHGLGNYYRGVVWVHCTRSRRWHAISRPRSTGISSRGACGGIGWTHRWNPICLPPGGCSHCAGR
jgi:hypothetical protein